MSKIEPFKAHHFINQPTSQSWAKQHPNIATGLKCTGVALLVIGAIGGIVFASLHLGGALGTSGHASFTATLQSAQGSIGKIAATILIPLGSVLVGYGVVKGYKTLTKSKDETYVDVLPEKKDDTIDDDVF